MKRLIFLMMFLLFFGCQKLSDGAPEIKNGMIDLSQWNFDKNGIVKLTGEKGPNWEPYIYGKKEDTAFFYLIIHLSEFKSNDTASAILAFRIPAMNTPYRLWLNDALILSNSQSMSNQRRGEYYNYSQIVDFKKKGQDLRLALKVFNYPFIKLIREPILVGTEKQIRDSRLINMFKEGFFLGIFIIMGLINILFWIIKRKDISILYLGILSIFLFFENISSGESLLFLPFLNYHLYLKGQILIYFLKLFFLTSFLYSTFPAKKNKWLIYAVLSSLSTLALFSIIFPWTLLNYILTSFQFFFLAINIFFIVRSLFYIKKNTGLSVIGLISLPFLTLAFAVDFFQYSLVITSISLLSITNYSTLSFAFLLFVIEYTYFVNFIDGDTSIKENESVKPSELFLSKYGITQRESEVIEFIIKRYSHKEIADSLFISLKTVETHIYHIYQKTGTKNRKELLNQMNSFGKS